MTGSDILILGSRGMVGSAVAAVARERAVLTTRPPVLNGTLPFDALKDDCASLIERIKPCPKAVVIAFGVSGVHTCANAPAETRHLNVDRVLAATSAVARLGILPVLFSSDSVFGDSPKLWSEEDHPDPINEYGRQKFAVEQGVASLGIPYLLVRLSRVIADHANHHDILFQWCDLIRSKKRIQLPTDQNFTPIAASDVGQIVISLIDAGARGLFHVAGPQRISAPQLFDMLLSECRRAGIDIDVNVDHCRVSDLPGLDRRLPNTMLSIERLRNTISHKFQPLTETARGVASAAFAQQSLSIP